MTVIASESNIVQPPETRCFSAQIEKKSILLVILNDTAGRVRPVGHQLPICVFDPAHSTFLALYGAMWASLNTNELCQGHALRSLYDRASDWFTRLVGS